MDRDYTQKINEAFLKEPRGRIYRAVIDNAEKGLIEKALELSYGNQVAAAKLLGMNRNTIRAKMKKLGINPEAYK